LGKKYDMISIGHIDNAILDFKGKVSRFIGGAVYFSSFAAHRSGIVPGVVTKLAHEDLGLLDDIKNEGIDVVALSSSKTTSIKNIFETDDVDRRKVVLLAQAEPFALADIPETPARVYHLAGLFRGEIPDSLIANLASRGAVALDLQGVLRANREGAFAWLDWAEKKKYLPYVTYLKADSLEAEVITGFSDREKAARILAEWGAKEVMISHSSEVIIYDGVNYYRAPFNPGNLSGRTGRGDTVFAAYIAWRLQGREINEALHYAAALTSIKMERPGPFLGSIEEVRKRMKVLQQY
jgi:sugar/nucleoside kinase (ribokinase family)